MKRCACVLVSREVDVPDLPIPWILIQKKTKFDLEFESQKIKILVDKKSHLYIKDTEIDWSYNLMDRGLKFNNPSAKGSCGCKTSFMFEQPEQEEATKPSWM